MGPRTSCPRPLPKLIHLPDVRSKATPATWTLTHSTVRPLVFYTAVNTADCTFLATSRMV